MAGDEDSQSADPAIAALFRTPTPQQTAVIRGHEKAPGFGHLRSPLVATEVPAFGHEKSPPLTRGIHLRGPLVRATVSATRSATPS